MRYLAALSLAMFGTQLHAQSIGTRKAGAAPPPPQAAAPKPAANTVAIYPFASAMAGGDVNRVLLLLAGKTSAAFTSNERWTVIDRSADALLQKEMEKIVSPESFNSSVLVKSDGRLGAQYVVYGYLDDAQVAQSDAGGQRSYDGTVIFSLRLANVETGKVEVVKSFTARSLDLDKAKLKERAEQQAKQQGIEAAKDKVVGIFKRDKNRNDPSTGDRASKIAVGSVSAKSPEEALRWASDRAETLVNEWAAEQAKRFVGASKP